MTTFRKWRVVPALLTVTCALATGIIGVRPAAAQLSPYGDQENVLVDLNAIGGGGGTQYYADSFGPDGQLLDPPARPPQSQLLVARPPVSGGAPQAEPESRITLSAPPPAAVPRAKPAAMAKKPVPSMPAVKAEPRAKVETAQAPEPPSPPPAPKVAKVEPPKPPAPPAPETAKPAPLAPPPAAPAASEPPPLPAVTAPKPTETAEKTAPKAAPAPEQASRTPAAEAPGDVIAVTFGPDEAELPQPAAAILDGVTKRLGTDAELRLQLMAYAGGPSLSSSKARRLSLSRALTVRSYLIDKGIRSSRIDVRALGDKVPAGEPNRVDIRYTRR